MKLSEFKFKLPQEKIAQYPARFRDESRMMVLHRKTGEIEHKVFTDKYKVGEQIFFPSDHCPVGAKIKLIR